MRLPYIIHTCISYNIIIYRYIYIGTVYIFICLNFFNFFSALSIQRTLRRSCPCQNMPMNVRSLRKTCSIFVIIQNAIFLSLSTIFLCYSLSLSCLSPLLLLQMVIISTRKKRSISRAWSLNNKKKN